MSDEETPSEEETNEIDAIFNSLDMDGEDDTGPRWAASKERGRARAEESEFDLEQMIFGSSLEDLIADAAEDRIARLKNFGDDTTVDNLLREICDALAGDISFRFDPEGKGSDFAIELAASLLYLYPKLWEATDRPFTMDEIEALDFDEFLDKRRPRRYH